jgi:putative hydrolase of the HAD superfamily
MEERHDRRPPLAVQRHQYASTAHMSSTMTATHAAGRTRHGEKAVIFDLGGVVLEWKPLELLRRFYEQDGEALRATVQRAVFDHPDWLELDRGTLTQARAIPRFATRAGRPEAEIARLMIAVRESLQPVPETLALMGSLVQAGVPLYCLSNMHAENAAWLLQTRDFWPMFRGVVFSADEKLIKPEPEIFQRLLTRYGLVAERTAFVDDHRPNVASAGRLGLHGIAFEDAAQCAAALQRWLQGGPST